MLTSPARKAELIEALGVDGLCVVPFTLALSQQSPQEFVHETLVESLHVATVVVGDNFRFGHRAAGDVALLAELGQRFGFTVSGRELVMGEAQRFSSTYVRACVAAGDVAAAATALSRPHRVEGVVVRGDQRGRELGFPTANLATGPYTAIPADGIYAGYLVHGGQQRRAAISVGSNPTFAGTERRVEAYVLDFDGDLYGATVAVDFVARIRDMERFTTIEALVAQIEADVAQVRNRV